MDNLEKVNDDKCHGIDNRSVVSDRCWEPQYGNDSRKWLTNYERPVDEQFRLVSTMKDGYRIPNVIEDKDKGAKRKVMMKRFYDEALEELKAEMNPPTPSNEYCTEYDGNYNTPGCPPLDFYRTDEELYRKYPLYTSPATSYWSHKIENSLEPEVYYNGLTESTDKKNPFKRNSAFTKPLDEDLNVLFR